MTDEKELDRIFNEMRNCDERLAWLKEELHLEHKLKQKRNQKISKLQRKIRGLKRQQKMLKEFDKELDVEFEEVNNGS